jgi:hypothetical protein
MSRLLFYFINLMSPTRPAHYVVGQVNISANHQLCLTIPHIRKSTIPQFSKLAITVDDYPFRHIR